VKDGSFSIHHQNIQRMAIEIYKDRKDNSSGLFKDLLIPSIRENRSKADFQIPFVSTVSMGQNSLRYLGPIIWNSIPSEIKELNSLNAFISKIKNWKPKNCPCCLCKEYLGGVGYVNISD